MFRVLPLPFLLSTVLPSFGKSTHTHLLHKDVLWRFELL